MKISKVRFLPGTHVVAVGFACGRVKILSTQSSINQGIYSDDIFEIKLYQIDEIMNTSPIIDLVDFEDDHSKSHTLVMLLSDSRVLFYDL